ncbi:MAG: phosphoglycolate phosphatase, partial [Paracoccaceae bacterium]|nr:phosphoglycolate phosphatase [Paracoccaceae bacterium]
MTAVVFDLDGTLIDSAPDIQAAANKMLAAEGKAPLDLPTVTSFIGNGLPKLVERVMRARGISVDEHARLTEMTLGFYNAAPSNLTRLYPGVRQALETLRQANCQIGLCTNKPVEPTWGILKDFDLTRFFDVVVGGDSLAVKKPDPAPLNAAFENLGVGSRYYVGDSEVDAETAARANVPFLLFTEG